MEVDVMDDVRRGAPDFRILRPVVRTEKIRRHASRSCAKLMSTLP